MIGSFSYEFRESRSGHGPIQYQFGRRLVQYSPIGSENQWEMLADTGIWVSNEATGFIWTNFEIARSAGNERHYAPDYKRRDGCQQRFWHIPVYYGHYAAPAGTDTRHRRVLLARLAGWLP